MRQCRPDSSGELLGSVELLPAQGTGEEGCTMRRVVFLIWLALSSGAAQHLSREDLAALRKVGLLQDVLQQSHGLLLKVVGSVPTLLPRLDAQECLKRTICEAHNKPRQYGLLGKGLQLAFPAMESWPGVQENSPVSALQLAARYGREPGADCGRHFDGCLLDVLNTLQVLVDYFFVNRHTG